MATFYEVLGVAPDADDSTLAAAYARAQELGGGSAAMDVQTAWYTLSNPQTRATYDKRLARAAEPTNSGPAAAAPAGYGITAPPAAPTGYGVAAPPAAPTGYGAPHMSAHGAPPGQASGPGALPEVVYGHDAGPVSWVRSRILTRGVVGLLLVALSFALAGARWYARSERRERSRDTIERTFGNPDAEAATWAPGSCVRVLDTEVDFKMWEFIAVQCSADNDGTIDSLVRPPEQCPADVDVVIPVNERVPTAGELCVTMAAGS